MPNAYGAPISLDAAKKAAAPVLAEAGKNSWTIAVAIVDPSGNLVYYEKMDNTQLGSANIAVDKARTAAMFKRSSKAFQDALAAGGEGLRVLGLQGVTPVEGGFPLLMDGKNRGRDRRLRHDECARRAVRQGRGRLGEVAVATMERKNIKLLESLNPASADLPATGSTD